MTLNDLPAGRAGRVLRVRDADPLPDRARQLGEIGFTPGEPVCVLRRAMPGGDPMVVRIGSSTFALRRAEAACVVVEPLDP
ncbi:MAG: ferrous iron transport protein A [Rubrivivax sp.]|jgi:ferrous iron transport protein A|nr:ferrous iron transport protein A [Rubrivivax sp.]